MSGQGVNIRFTGDAGHLQKALDGIITKASATAKSFTDMVATNRKHIQESSKHAASINQNAAAYDGVVQASRRYSKQLQELTTTYFPNVRNEAKAVQKIYGTLLGSLMKGTTVFEKNAKGMDDYTKMTAHAGMAMREVMRRTTDFQKGLSGLVLEVSKFNKYGGQTVESTLPAWVNGLGRMGKNANGAALAQQYLAGNIQVVGNTLKFANDEVAKSVGLNEEQIKKMRPLISSYDSYTRLLKSADSQTYGYRTALEALSESHGAVNGKVKLYESALRQASTAVGTLRNNLSLHDTGLQRIGERVSVANVAYGLLNKNLQVTSDGIRILNSQGLVQAGVTEKQARELGLLSKNYDQYEKNLARVNKEAGASSNVFKALAQDYNSNSLSLEKVAKATVYAQRKADDLTQVFKAKRNSVAEGSKEYERYSRVINHLGKESTVLSIAAGKLNKEYKENFQTLSKANPEHQNHTKTLRDAALALKDSFVPLKEYRQGLRDLGVSTHDGSAATQKLRKSLLDTSLEVDKLRQANPDLAKSMNLVSAETAKQAGALDINSKGLRVLKEEGLRALGVNKDQAIEMGILSGRYSALEGVIQKITGTNKQHAQVLRKVAAEHGDSAKHNDSLARSYREVQGAISESIRGKEKEIAANKQAGKSTTELEDSLRKLNGEQHLHSQMAKRYEGALSQAGLATNFYAGAVKNATEKMSLSAPMQNIYGEGLQRLAPVARTTSEQLSILSKDYDKVFGAMLKMGTQAGLSEKDMKSLMSNTAQLSQITQGLGDKYRVVGGRIQELDKQSRRWLSTQASVNAQGQVSIQNTGQLAGSYETLGKQIGSVHGGLNRIYSALRVTASYMVAGTAVFQLVNAFTSAVGAIFQFDQALKNLQAITKATPGQLLVMDEVIRRVAATTKFSAMEIGDAMVTIGQAGFSAAESIKTIQAVADLASGTLATLKASSQLVTTGLKVFNLEADESARVADVFASAVNRSKITVDGLNVVLNYLGPVAKSSGMQLEEAAAATMVLANAGIRYSTIGTSMRQVISRLLSPTARLRAMMEESGHTLEEFNIQTQNAETGGRGFTTVMQNLAGVIGNDTNKAFAAFGLRGASAALVLAHFGKTIEFVVDQASEVGAAARMAEIQLGGLELTAKNLYDRLGLLAITFGENLAPAIRAALDAMRAFVTVLTAVVGHPIGQFVVAVGLMTGAVAALVYGLKILVATSLYKFLGESVMMLMRNYTLVGMLSAAYTALITVIRGYVAGQVLLIAGNVTLAASIQAGTASILSKTAAVSVLKGALASLWLLIKSNPFAVLVIALSAATYAMYKWRDSQVDAIAANEKAAIKAKDLADSYTKYAERLDAVGNDAVSFSRIQERLLQQFPELASEITKTGITAEGLASNLRGLSEAQRVVAREKLETHFDNITKALRDNDKAIQDNRNTIKSGGGAWGAFKEAVLSTNAALTYFFAPATLVIATYKGLEAAVKGKEKVLKEANEALAKGLITEREYARQLGIVTYNLMENAKELGNMAAYQKYYADALAIGEDKGVSFNRTLEGTIKALQQAQIWLGENSDQMGEFTQSFVMSVSALDEVAREKWIKLYDSVGDAAKASVIEQAAALNEANSKIEDSVSKGVYSYEMGQALIEQNQKKHFSALLEEQLSYGDSILSAINDRYAKESAEAKKAYDARIAMIRQELVELNQQGEGYAETVKGIYERLNQATAEYHDKQRLLAEEAHKAELAFYDALPEAFEANVLIKKLDAQESYNANLIDLYTQERQEYQQHYETLTQIVADSSGKILEIVAKAAEDRLRVDRELSAKIIEIENRTAQEVQRIRDELAGRLKTIAERQLELQMSLMSEERKQAEIRKLIAEEFSSFNESLRNKDFDSARQHLDKILSYERQVVEGRVQAQEDGSKKFIADEQATVDARIALLDQVAGAEKQLTGEKIQDAEKRAAVEKTLAQESADVQIAEINKVEKEAIASHNKRIEVITREVETTKRVIQELDTELAKLRDIQIEITLSNFQESMDKVRTAIKDFNDKDAEVLIQFMGSGSDTKPIMEKVAEIERAFAEFSKKLEALPSEIHFAFTGDGGKGKQGLLNIFEELNATLEKLQALSKDLGIDSLSQHEIKIVGFDILKKVLDLHVELDGKHTESSHTISKESIQVAEVTKEVFVSLEHEVGKLEETIKRLDVAVRKAEQGKRQYTKAAQESTGVFTAMIDTVSGGVGAVNDLANAQEGLSGTLNRGIRWVYDYITSLWGISSIFAALMIKTGSFGAALELLGASFWKLVAVAGTLITKTLPGLIAVLGKLLVPIFKLVGGIAALKARLAVFVGLTVGMNTAFQAIGHTFAWVWNLFSEGIAGARGHFSELAHIWNIFSFDMESFWFRYWGKAKTIFDRLKKEVELLTKEWKKGNEEIEKSLEEGAITAERAFEKKRKAAQEYGRELAVIGTHHMEIPKQLTFAEQASGVWAKTIGKLVLKYENWAQKGKVINNIAVENRRAFRELYAEAKKGGDQAAKAFLDSTDALIKLKGEMSSLGVKIADVSRSFLSSFLALPEEFQGKWLRLYASLGPAAQVSFSEQAVALNKYVGETKKAIDEKVITSVQGNALIKKAEKEHFEFLLKESIKHHKALEDTVGDRYKELFSLISEAEKTKFETSKKLLAEELTQLDKHRGEYLKVFQSIYEDLESYYRNYHQNQYSLNILNDHLASYKQMFEALSNETFDYYDTQRGLLEKEFEDRTNIWKGYPEQYDALVNKELHELEKERLQRLQALNKEELADINQMYADLKNIVAENEKARNETIKKHADDRQKIEDDLAKEIKKYQEEIVKESDKAAEERKKITEKAAQEIAKIESDLVKNIQSIQKGLFDSLESLANRRFALETSLLNEEQKSIEVKKRINEEFDKFKDALNDGDLDRAKKHLDNISSLESQVVEGRLQTQKDGSQKFIQNEEVTVAQRGRVLDALEGAEKDLADARIKEAERASQKLIEEAQSVEQAETQALDKSLQEFKTKTQEKITEAQNVASAEIVELDRVKDAVVRALDDQGKAYTALLNSVSGDIKLLQQEIAQIQEIRIELALDDLNTGLKAAETEIRGFRERIEAITSSPIVTTHIIETVTKSSPTRPFTEGVAYIKSKLKEVEAAIKEAGGKVLIHFRGTASAETGATQAAGKAADATASVGEAASKVDGSPATVDFSGTSDGAKAAAGDVKEVGEKVKKVKEEVKEAPGGDGGDGPTIFDLVRMGAAAAKKAIKELRDKIEEIKDALSDGIRETHLKLADDIIGIETSLANEIEGINSRLVDTLLSIHNKRLDLDLTLLEGAEKNARIREEIERAHAKVKEAIRQEDLVAAERYLNQISSLESKLQGETQEETVEMRKQWLDEMETIEKQLADIRIKQAKEEAEEQKKIITDIANHQIAEMKRVADEQIKIHQDMISKIGAGYSKMQQAIEIVHRLNRQGILASIRDIAAMEKAIREVSEGYKTVIEFSGKASPEKPLTETMADIEKMFDKFKKQVEEKKEAKVDIFGLDELDEVLDHHKALDGKRTSSTHTINVEEKRNKGGFIGKLISRFADGGQVPGGYGTEDDVPAVLTRGEYVHPVSAVKHYGTEVMEAIKNKLIPKELLQYGAALKNHGKSMMQSMGNMMMPNVQMLNAGGLVQPARVNASSGYTATVNLNIGGNQYITKMEEPSARKLVDQLKTMNRRM